MAFNLALSWKRSFLHVSLYFFHLLFSQNQLVVIVFFMFCPVSGLVGWLWQQPFHSKGAGHRTYHQNNFFPGGNLTEWHAT